MVVQQHVLNWLYSVLTSEYHDVNRTYNDVAQALSNYPSLSPRTDVHTFPNGASALLLHLSGTIPVVFRGTTYRFPISLWVPHAYPREAPLVYVTPTETMMVRPGQHVDPQGQVYHPYLVGWATFWDKSTILDFLAILRDVFAKEPPVIAKQQGQQAATQQNPTPPPVPPLPSAARRSLSQYESGAPEVVLQQQQQQPPQSSRYDRPPPLPPTNRPQSTASYSTHSAHEVADNSYPGPPRPAPPPPAATGSQAGFPPGPSHGPPQPQYMQSDARHAAYAQPPSFAPQQPNWRQAPPAAQIQQPQARPPPPPDLMDDDLALTIPSPSSVPAPAIPPNPEKDALLHQLAQALYALRQRSHAQNESSLAGLQAQRTAMLSALGNIQTDMTSLAQLSTLLKSNTAILQDSLRKADDVIENSSTHPAPSIDQLLVAPTVVGNQLYELVAEERALADAIFVLGRAVERGRIAPGVFAKMTRTLAREWYLKKALIRKIGVGMGLA